MNVDEFQEITCSSSRLGDEMYQLMEELFPICRSITGNGVRISLKIISNHIPLTIFEVPTDTQVFDWTIPKEWNINDAYIKNNEGQKILDFKKSNIHVVNYSVPIRKRISFKELKQHIHTIPSQPDVIPYLTSYYNEYWGFCMTHNDFIQLKNGEYEVVIDSSLKNGSLTYGEFFIKGKSDQEIVFSCYICHPSLCNDSLSGVVLTTILAKHLSKFNNYFSYRFLFIPETIGAITWLSRNEENLSKIVHGLVVTCVGDPGNSTYKKSRNGNNVIDLVVEKVLKESKEPYEILDFFPTGSDERQFCSPGINLPFGSLMRTPYDKFLQYHTSADNLEFIKKENLENSLAKYFSIINELENNHTDYSNNVNPDNNKKSVKKDELVFLNLYPKCEPQLGKRGLYQKLGGIKDATSNKLAILWILNQSDGNNSLSDIAKKSDIDYKRIVNAAKLLKEANLIKQIN